MYRRIILQEVKSITGMLPTNYYMAGMYPFSGLWMDPSNTILYIVDKKANTVQSICYSEELDKNVFKDYKEPKPVEIVPATKAEYAGISENMVLKMLAVVRSPNLAKELTNV